MTVTKHKDGIATPIREVVSPRGAAHPWTSNRTGAGQHVNNVLFFLRSKKTLDCASTNTMLTAEPWEETEAVCLVCWQTSAHQTLSVGRQIMSESVCWTSDRVCWEFLFVWSIELIPTRVCFEIIVIYKVPKMKWAQFEEHIKSQLCLRPQQQSKSGAFFQKAVTVQGRKEILISNMNQNEGTHTIQHSYRKLEFLMYMYWVAALHVRSLYSKRWKCVWVMNSGCFETERNFGCIAYGWQLSGTFKPQNPDKNVISVLTAPPKSNEPSKVARISSTGTLAYSDTLCVLHKTIQILYFRMHL